MSKYLDKEGLGYLWEKIENYIQANQFKSPLLIDPDAPLMADVSTLLQADWQYEIK